MKARQTITSWMCPKQYLALRIKAAFSRDKARVTPASIVERAVPSASLSPFAPGDVIAILFSLARWRACAGSDRPANHTGRIPS